ncbi:ATP-binding protein [Desulfococcaceae bacterium HSG8]|nr:ATP-binding protein [Desulfococcaceae bacterium HSG8]
MIKKLEKYDISVGKKLGLAISPLVLLSVCLIIFSYQNMNFVQAEIRNISELAIVSTQLVHRASAAFNRQSRFYEDVVFLHDINMIKNAEQASDEAAKSLGKLRRMDDICIEHQDRIDSFLNRLKHYTASAGPVYRHMAERYDYLKNPENARMVKSLGQEKNELEAVLNGFPDIVRKDISERIDYFDVFATQRNNINTFISALVIAISMLIIYVLIEYAVTGPMTEANQKLQKAIDALQNEMASAREAREAAEAANLAKSAFLASMSHELRTPLNVILGLAQIMTRSGELGTEHRKELETINRSGEHLLSLINDVLDLSKIESGRMGIEEQEFDLYHILDSLEDMFRSKAEKKNLGLIFSRDADVPRYVAADRTKLRQILINLLGNAIKFTEKGAVSLRVMTDKGLRMNQDAAQTVLVFEIEDTGPGIDPEDIEILFVPFMQTEIGKAAHEGTGLGLALSRKYVHLMGGDIDVESVPGKGSVFRFHISANPAVASGIIHADDVPRVKYLAPDQPAYRILIADDKPDNRYLFVKLLTRAGFEMKEAGNGKEAVNIWKSWHPHLIWMDILMPVTDGCEATRIIRELEIDKIPIIAVSASIFKNEQELVRAAGCDDFVAKPVSETEIFDMMQKHLGVSYVYENSDSSRSGKPSEMLTPDSLSGLSSEMLVKLRNAAEELDPEMIRQAIHEIRQTEPLLADGLSVFADNYEYDKITSLILKIRNSNF